MSQTTLPVPAAKQPRPSRAERPRLLTPIKRGSTKIRARALPILSVIPGFEQCNVNDARTVLAYLYDKPENYQTHAKRRDGLGGFKAIKEDTGLSRRRLQSALRYLEATGIKRTATVMGDGGFKGRCYVLDLDGKAPEHHVVVDFHQAENRKRLTSKHRADTRWKHNPSAESWAPTEEPKPSLLDDPQYLPKVVCTEAVPQYPYNDIPTEALKKEPLLSPLRGENFQSLPGDSQDPQELQDLQGGSESPDTPEVTLPDPQDSQDEIKTTSPVSEEILELIEDLGLRQPDPVRAPTFYLQAQTALEADRCDHRAPLAWSHHRRGRLAIEKLQQGSRPRKEAALAWFKANLPGWLLEDCLRPGEAITVMVAHKLVRKLHGGSLTLDHFARYWAAVQTERCKRLPLVHVVNLLSSAFAIKNEQDAEHATSAAARVHDKFGRALYRGEHVDADLVIIVPGMWVPRRADTTAWAPDALYESLQGWRSDQLTEGYADRFLWAARIYALAGYMGDRHACVAPLLRDVSAANITKQDVCRWFVESPRGRPIFVRVEREFGTCGLDTFDVFGLDANELHSRAWRLWVCLAAVRESQLRIPYANMNLNDFCRF